MTQLLKVQQLTVKYDTATNNYMGIFEIKENLNSMVQRSTYYHFIGLHSSLDRYNRILNII